MDTENHPLSEQVCALLADAIQVPLDMVSPELEFGDLPQWDSLGHMELMIRLEEQYNIEINADTIAELVSITEICNYLERNGHGR